METNVVNASETEVKKRSRSGRRSQALVLMLCALWPGCPILETASPFQGWETTNFTPGNQANSVQTTFQYDPLNRVTGMSSAIGGYTYQLGPTGNRTSALEQNGRSVTWSYDGIYRLTSERLAQR